MTTNRRHHHSFIPATTKRKREEGTKVRRSNDEVSRAEAATAVAEGVCLTAISRRHPEFPSLLQFSATLRCVFVACGGGGWWWIVRRVANIIISSYLLQ